MNNETNTDVPVDPVTASLTDFLSTVKGKMTVLDKPIRAYRSAVDARDKIPHLAKQIETVSGMRVEAAIRVHEALSMVDVGGIPSQQGTDSGDDGTSGMSSPVRDRIVAYFRAHGKPEGIRLGEVARGLGIERNNVFQCMSRNKETFKCIERGLYVMEAT